MPHIFSQAIKMGIHAQLTKTKMGIHVQIHEDQNKNPDPPGSCGRTRPGAQAAQRPHHQGAGGVVVVVEQVG